MRDALTLRAIHILALVLLSALSGSCDPCDSSLDPVKCSDLCEQPRPHEACAKCTNAESRFGGCPQCDEPNPLPGCPNYRAPGDSGVNDASGDGAVNPLSGGMGGVGGIGGGGSGGAGVTGGMGGMGGAGGDVMGVVCQTDANCSATEAVCGEDNRCGPCTSNAHCERYAGSLVCDTRPDLATTGRCVDCLDEQTDCTSDDNPECVLGFCVECEVHGDCESNTTSQCNPTSYKCEACTDDAACAGRGDRTICDTRSTSDNAGECVECRTHADCEDEETPQCDATGACVPCTIDDACEDRMDGETPISYCNTRADASTFGRCVQCTGATEASCPEETACKQSTGECTDTTVNSLEVCDACEADSECMTGMKCVAVSFDSATIGTYCLYAEQTEEGCADDDTPSARPFSNPETLPSLDGASATYCLPPTTCEAFKHAAAGHPCETYDDCGLGMEDGFCPTTGDAAFKCSYACVSSNDCLETGLSVCPSVGVKFCRRP